MNRVFITSVLALLFVSVWQGLFSHFDPSFNLFYMPPLVLVFSLHFFNPLENITLALFCGYIADVLGGFVIGQNMILMLLLAFVVGSLNVFARRPLKGELAYYVAAMSLIYRTTLLVLQVFVLGSSSNIFIFQLFLGPLIDALMSLIFFSILIAILSALRLLDQNEMFKNRLGFYP